MTGSERNIITKGIILKSSVSGDQNRLFSFISPDLGVERALAYGGEKIKSRFCSTIVPFADLKLFLYRDPKTNLYSIKDVAEPLIAENFKKELKTIYLTAFFANVILNSLLDQFDYKKYYMLLKYSLELIEVYNDPVKAFLFFTTKLIVLHGQEIRYSCCRECKRSDNTLFYSKGDYDIFCSDHISGDKIAINKPDAEVMDAFINLKYVEIKEMHYKLHDFEAIRIIQIHYIKKIYCNSLRNLDDIHLYF
ncbi:MAG: DNA repair protein RecO [Spirochaetes bacterium GWF1_31_7]|nr:MAG: DNA repair protein RecO [Spirochaetes bacterium GWE1_32_154]OHD48248.1 MAG: DNA repair protein RecO [Spirochaetes bacterium GWE2_31_10]OHD50651.1 MAG: DNA repair protein RecO [Spirochaetes bacterium GWF1_31_7]OHD82131.1 MAG: DNA repair protein RecO [Spirochaetes bacterium RIFOXYB1_FULL_32_8]HBI37698.1 DNA repair protein RecO [Spirochaetia bacterium]